ncbi:MAG: ATP-binding protein [Aulosira sp. ZfuVER01]|nr:ATP-binding protein [Aulosira sp. ZfuVER01]MDZ7998996.1 ATP-binding protein [Aulosira sp. DedVER01a]MDZ8051280.1 ATP-binding protein [Aulosira sp. ZfuCHP01]
MNSEDAFEFMNGLILEKTKISLNECERDVFLGIWASKTYGEISQEKNRDYQYVKETGPKLFKKIGTIFQINLNKNNFKPTIEQLYKQYTLRKISEIPQRDDVITNLSIAQQDRPAYTDNPFIPLNDIITEQHLLFGREREITRVFETLNSGSSVALIGEKKIGKSSLLQAIYQQAQHQLLKPRKAIYINLSLIFNDDDFYDELCNKVRITVSKGRKLIRELQKQQLLLLLDEVQQMTWDGFTRELRQQLRGLADGQANPPLRLVIAASEHLDVLFPDSRDNPSPFQGVCIEEVIKPWEENIVRGFIDSRLVNTQVSFTEEEIIQLTQESGGHPQRLMHLCYRTYSRYMERIKTEL